METNEVDIPDDLLNRFESAEFEQDGADFGETDAETVRDSLDNLNDTIKLGISAFDSYCKDQGLPGTGSIEHDKFARLCGLVAKRNMPTRWLEKSPELMFAGTLAGIVAQNYIALQQKQKSNQESEGSEDNE